MQTGSGHKIHYNVNPDRQAKYFGREGEFSPSSDLGFDKHIKRLTHFNWLYRYKYKLNGKAIYKILTDEPLWYS